ncbi:MAG: DUF481 domain-containing protein [Planctomycetes bacterium]|nr:DUF481 domain-containing protein [Planctomycetota bacterium]
MRPRPEITLFLRLAALLALLTVSPALADQVELNNGDVLRGTVLDRTGERLVLEHAVLGRIIIPNDQVHSVIITPREVLEEYPPRAIPRDVVVADPRPGASTAPPPATPATTAPATGAVRAPLIAPTLNEPLHGPNDPLDSLIQDTGLFGGKLPWPLQYLRSQGFKSQFEFGFSGTQGKSDTSTARVGFITDRKTTDTRSHFDATYYLATSLNTTTRNDLSARDQEDWLFVGTPWYWFVEGTYDFNEFADWDHRIAGATGPGYQLIQTPSFDLRIRGGGGASKEFGSDHEEIVPEGLIGGEFLWRLSDRQKLAASSAFYPDLLDPTDNRSTTTADWSYLLDRVQRLTLRMGVKLEYQSETSDSTPNADMKFFGALVFGF